MEHWTAFERAYVTMAIGMLAFAIIGGAITIGLLNYLDPDRREKGGPE